MRNLILSFFLTALAWSSFLHAQMLIDGELHYGNEWIDFDRSYFKIELKEDGVYKITGSDLENAGVNLSDWTGQDLNLIQMGKEVPIYVSTQAAFSPNDFIIFKGEKNRGSLDKHLYETPETMQLNPEHSLFSDVSAYFLTWSNGTHLRINDIDNDLSGALSPEEFYIHEEKLVVDTFHVKPTYNGDDKVRLSSFDIVEGFGSFLLKKTNLRIPTSSRYPGSGIDPSIEIRFASNSTKHELSVSTGGTVLYEENFSGYKLLHIEESFDFDLLNNTSTFEIEGALPSDSYSIAYGILKYPRALNFSEVQQLRFYSRAGADERLYALENFSNNSEDIYAFDWIENTRKRIPLSDNKRSFKVNNNQEKKLIDLVSESGFKNPLNISEISFVDYSQMDPEFLIVTSERIYDMNFEGQNMVEAYANHRRSDNGGNFNVSIVYIEDLYHQYSYGIERNPLSCRNFINHMEDQWSNLQFIFTIGKGVEYSVLRSEEDFNNPLISETFVPTWGVPGSDNLLFGRKGGAAPIVSVGRLAAKSATDIKTYFDKVISHETIFDRDHTPEELQWTKKIIHLSGGDFNIQEQIFNWLNEMKKIIEADAFGAEVTTFRKSSTDLLQDADSEEILNTINNGVSLITFFGHSAVGTFDFSLESASQYDNTGRYPLLISLGCHSGNIYAGSNSLGLSEEFVLEPERGALAFLASTSTAYIGPQYITGRTFYDYISKEFYGQPIGLALKAYFDANASNEGIAVKSLIQQMTYHGDPSLRFVAFDAPDYLVDRSSIKMSPGVITTSDDYFNVDFDVINIGKSIRDSFDITIRHLLPDGSLASESTFEITAPFYKEHVSLELTNPGLDALGKNNLEIIVDSGNRITELPDPEAEDNNRLSYILNNDGFEFFIESNIAKPVSPSEFSIVNSDKVHLIASTTNLFAEETDYLLQIDTSELFELPLEETIVTNSGGKISWFPELNFQDETVYYWRISPNDIDSAYIWKESSFVYLPEQGNGWNQSHFYQYKKDEFAGLDLPRHEQLQFDTNGFFISVHNRIFNPENPPCYQFNFENCASSVRPWFYMKDGGVAIVVGDETSGSAWLNSGEAYGSLPGNSNQSGRVFGFLSTDEIERQKVINLFNDIPDGAYVWFFTIFNEDSNNIEVEEWRGDTLSLGTSILTLLDEQGAGLTSELEQLGNVPYTFVFQKGKGVLAEEIGSSIYDELNTVSFIPIKDTKGNLRSTLVGPAVSWGHLDWKISDVSEADSISINITGITKDGDEEFLGLVNNEFIYDISEIPASQYPYLRLDLYAQDPVERIPPQLDHWRVFYEAIPEAIYNPLAHFNFESDTLEQGEFLNFSVNVENVTGTPMDELLVHYTIIGEDNIQIPVSRVEDKLNANGNINISFSYPTSTLKGNYQFIVEFNPDFDQAEQFIFDNIGIRTFYVKQNLLNPVLDVSFDGQRIADGAFVSPTPEIRVSLHDNNRFLFNTDPENFQQAILFPDGSRIDYTMPDDALEFIAGSSDNGNVASMIIRPNTLEPGDYTFLAQAKNASGIFSGANEYQVDFRVKANNCLYELYNYPNPFSLSTKFAYSLIGSNPPDKIELEIYDATGKWVRTIREWEILDNRIGGSRLFFEWDGTNNGGSPLANGIYFYRLLINGVDDNSIYKNCGDEFDAKMQGRLVLMK